MERKETCKICQEAFDQKDFGRHLRKHKILVQEYYEKFYPKHDLLTGEKIFFSTKENYFLHEFSSRDNFLRYTQENFDLDFLIKTFQRHFKIKKWRKAPCQVELRTSVLPSRNYFDVYVDDYALFVEKVGLKYPYSTDPVFKTLVAPPPSDLEIWQDTREQTPLSFSCPSRKVKLDFGDYTAGGKNHSGIFIERKSLNDFVGTISQGFDRFKEEIKRAANLDSYLIVCVEISLNDAMHFKLQHVKATPVFIFHRVRELIQEFDNIQFVFPASRSESSELIVNLLSLGEECKSLDLQYHYEKKQLCGKNLPEKK